jgi:hypothetical protein
VGLVAKKKTDQASTVEDDTGGGGSGGGGTGGGAVDVSAIIRRAVADEMERQRLHTLELTAEGKKAVLTTEAPVGQARPNKTKR